MNKVTGTKRDLLWIFLVGLSIRCLFLTLFPVPYGEDAFGRIYFREEIFLAHWLPLTQVVVYLISRLTDGVLLVRLTFALLGSLAACGFYLFLKGMVRRRAALQGGLLFTVNALFVQLSLMPYQDVLFLGLFYASLAFLLTDDSVRVLLAERPGKMQPAEQKEGPLALLPGEFAERFWGPLFLGLACLTRYESWFLLPFLVLGQIRSMVRTAEPARWPLTILRVALVHGWGPLLWFALSWIHFGTWNGFLFQTESGEFYAYHPHFDLRWMLGYGARMLYWVGLFGSPLMLLSVVGLVRLVRWKELWHPRLKILLLTLFSVMVFFFVVIGKGQDTVFRFSALPLSALLVFVVFGWEACREWLERHWQPRPLLRALISERLVFVGLVAALVLYAAIPLARLNANPQFRDPYEVADFLRARLGSGETAMILAPGSDDPAEAAPLAYQRVVAQSGWAGGRIQSARLMDLAEEEDLLADSSHRQIRWLVVFEGVEPRVPAERFYAALAERQPAWLQPTKTLDTVTIYSVSAWPETLEDLDDSR